VKDIIVEFSKLEEEESKSKPHHVVEVITPAIHGKEEVELPESLKYPFKNFIKEIRYLFNPFHWGNIK
jgi:hypothetical protein